MNSRPTDAEYAASFAGYVSLVPETDVMTVLDGQVGELRRVFRSGPTEKEKYRYAEGKWSLRQVCGHLIDAERVFAYRAFCISRGEKVSLPGFDENVYVAQSRYDEIPLVDLVAELTSLRKANLLFLGSLDDQAWQRTGTANNNPVSVRALAYIMAGHVRHHFTILRERYRPG